MTVQKDKDGVTILDGQVNVANICCVSKAQMGDYVTSLSPQDLKKVAIAVARSLDLMTHYNRLKKRLPDKLKFIDRIKQDRNIAQDYIKKLRTIAQVSTDDELEEFIRSKLTSSGGTLDKFLFTLYV